MLWLGVMIACSGPSNIGFDGRVMDSYFPLDGLRSWTYSSQDPSIPYKVVGVLNPEGVSVEEGTDAVHTIDYTTECIGTAECTPGPFRVRNLQVSSNRSKGIRLHGVEDEVAGVIAYDPPVVLAGATGVVGDTSTTTSGGVTFVSTFIEEVDCPVLVTDEWGDGCVHLTLDDGGAGTPLAGSYWLVPGYALAAFHWSGDPVNAAGSDLIWRLLDTTFEEEQ
jgi:hypothetical protein